MINTLKKFFSKKFTLSQCEKEREVKHSKDRERFPFVTDQINISDK